MICPDAYERLLWRALGIRLLLAVERLDPDRPKPKAGVTRNRELLTILHELEDFADILLHRGNPVLEFRGVYDRHEDDPQMTPHVDPVKQMKYEEELEALEQRIARGDLDED